jgi:2-isopropylmalate synthase
MNDGSERIVTFDTTLRDGSQTEGVNFSCEDKLDILRRLDSFGMDFVEGGWPGSNPRDDMFFSMAETSERCNLVAFGSTRRHGNDPADDLGLRNLVECKAGWCCIFGKSWDFQVTDALRIGLDENLDLIQDSVEYLVSQGKHVIFDAEHFFDGYRSNPYYSLRVLKAAEMGGAEWIVLCDTNGGSLPSEISEAVEDAMLTINVPLGIHCHNDSDLATANTMAAVESGCRMVQGTVNGLGERCGNANMCSILPNLVLKNGYDLGNADLEQITSLSKYIGEVANMSRPTGMPYVGDSAFTHKGGIHASAVIKDSRTYEHIDPSLVGNERRILVSDMAGKASISEKLRELGLDMGEDSNTITDRIKDMESKGYQFEGADASFELLVKRLRGEVTSSFEILGFRVFTDENNGTMDSEATVKVRNMNGEVEHTAAEGNGPVNALDNAIRKALVRFFPSITSMRLTDYKVRVLDEKAATAACVRVLMRSTDGRRSWTTVGVSGNVLEASLIALVDSIEYTLIKNDSNNEVKTE